MNLQELLSLGIDESATKEIAGKVRLTNMICLFSLPLCLLSILIGVIIIEKGVIYSFTFTTFLFALVPYFNFLGQNKIARISLSSLPSLIILVTTLWIGEISLGHVIAYSYAMIGIALFPVVLMDFETEKGFIYALLTYHLIIVMFFDVIMIDYTAVDIQNIFWSFFIQLKIAQFILLTFVLGVSFLLIAPNKTP
jgi:hypothetical protein